MRAAFFSCMLFLVVACSGSSASSVTPDAAAGPPPGSTASCSTTSGQTACGLSLCRGNEWCDRIICLAGCQSAANCEQGQFCDKTGSTSIDQAGVCRACSAPPPPVCKAVGNYRTYARSDNPRPCSRYSLGTCSVTPGATPDTLNVGCDGAGGFRQTTCTYSAATCSCATSFDFGGTPVSMAVDFTGGDIQLSGNGVLCEFGVIE